MPADTSLNQAPSAHPRCPADCRHKAPATVVTQFDKLFWWRGAAKAAKWAREQRGGKS